MSVAAARTSACKSSKGVRTIVRHAADVGSSPQLSSFTLASRRHQPPRCMLWPPSVDLLVLGHALRLRYLVWVTFLTCDIFAAFSPAASEFHTLPGALTGKRPWARMQGDGGV